MIFPFPSLKGFLRFKLKLLPISKEITNLNNNINVSVCKDIMKMRIQINNVITIKETDMLTCKRYQLHNFGFSTRRLLIYYHVEHQ